MRAPNVAAREAPPERTIGRAGEAGFLYVEALIGICIISTILLATFPMFVMAMKVDTASDELTMSTNLARGKAEQLLSQPYALVVGGQDTFRAGSRQYRRVWVVQDDSPYVRMKSVTVTVAPVRQLNWGRPRTATLSFYRAQ